MVIPSKSDIEKTHTRISKYIHRTPVLTNQYIDSLVEGNIYFKCENFQKVGAFKARGALNASLLYLEKGLIKDSIATHSSGNHAQAVAYAAKQFGLKAYIVMPSNAPEVKKRAVKDYGGQVIECTPTLEARESTLSEVIQETGAFMIHPFNDYAVIAGQATAAKELTEDVEGLDQLITPVGGGGLLSGTILWRDYNFPQIAVFAGEPEGADDTFRSVAANNLIPMVSPNTIADGLLTSLGDKTFSIIRSGVKAVLCVSDEEISKAQQLVMERMKIVIEPSSAVPLAAILRNKDLFKGKKTGLIISGGNYQMF